MSKVKAKKRKPAPPADPTPPAARWAAGGVVTTKRRVGVPAAAQLGPGRRFFAEPGAEWEVLEVQKSSNPPRPGRQHGRSWWEYRLRLKCSCFRAEIVRAEHRLRPAC